MKKRLFLYKDGNRLYLKDIDLYDLRPLLNLVKIPVHVSPHGKYTGEPQHYILITDALKFILSLTDDYIIIIR